MSAFNVPSKIEKLNIWCVENNIQKNNVLKVFDMLKLGEREETENKGVLQFPTYYFEDSQAKAWHSPADYTWVKLLEDNFEDIKQEALYVFENNLVDVHPKNDDLAGYGTRTFSFYKNGGKYLNNHKQCPKTSKVLEQISGVDIAGRTYFTAMPPGIHVDHHCGPHNFKIRTHLGIIAPKEAMIRVGDVTKSWPEGKCIVFDDSFDHEVWNKSNITRIVMIVDVWNPILTDLEKQALEYIMPEFYQRTEII